MNQIIIQGLQLDTHIGITPEERATPQRLLVNIVLIPENSFADLYDEIAKTVDYHAVSIRITGLAAERPRKLLETLAHEIALTLIGEFAIEQLDVEIQKFILPNTTCVAVRTTLTREEAQRHQRPVKRRPF